MPARPTLALSLLTLSLASCAPSHWERRFIPLDPATDAPRTPARNVHVRHVPWERLAPVLDDLRRQVAASDAPVNEWPPDRKHAADQQLLTALQVTPQSGVTRILGVSEFRTTDFSSPDPAQLQSLAAKHNATLVVWSSYSLGPADRLDYVPVTTWTTGSYYPRRDRQGRVRSDSYNESSTTWTPVVTEAEETAFLAYFLR